MQSVIQIRELFLHFFKNNGYEILPSASLIPKHDPDLLFINSGMAPFKDYFLGQTKPGYNRWATCQKCMRAGGKHNDLNQIGYSSHHHTLFEMLGNFEINAPHPNQMIEMAWRFVTQELQLPESKLSVSVLAGDESTEHAWKKFLPTHKIHRLGLADNFWQIGETGPCGPCTEIFYTPDVKSQTNTPWEIWNLVFVKYRLDDQHNRQNLPYVSIDTGMGLERITAVVQGVFDNYKSDIFAESMKLISQYSHHKSVLNNVNREVSTRIVVDHMRAVVFLISEGLLPINLGRGYVLRRVLRRALFHMCSLVSTNKQEDCICDLVRMICRQSAVIYNEMKTVPEKIIQVIMQEKQRFERTMQQGYQFLMAHLQKNQSTKCVDGDFVFKLYDTYGFPVEATCDVVRKQNKSIDMQAFDKAMQRQINSARQARKQYSLVALPNDVIELLVPLATRVKFVGFEKCKTTGSKILALVHDNKLCADLKQSQNLSYVIVNETPFYAEAGGQVGDTGKITGPQGQFMVTDTIRLAGLPLSIIVHAGYMDNGKLQVIDLVDMQVDQERRRQIMCNHSCTHILSQALHDRFGAEQMGSLVLPDKLRFDFSVQTKITAQDQYDLEKLVNGIIWQGGAVRVEMMSAADAIHAGVRVLRNEKYPDPMRTVTMGSYEGKDFSREACGGTHVKSVSDIGFFVIHSIDTVSAGVKRIEAFTQEPALIDLQDIRTQALQVSQALNVPVADLGNQVNKLLTKSHMDQKNLQKLDMTVLLHCCAKEHTLPNQKKVQIRYHRLHSNVSFSNLAKVLQQSCPGIHIIWVYKQDKYSVLISVHEQISHKLSALQILHWMQDNLSVNGNGSYTLAQGGTNKLCGSMDQIIDDCLKFIIDNYDVK